jgi:hypothetical protein
MKCNTSQPPDLERTNPFCAARLRPGTIDYVFEEGNGLPRLVDLLEANGWLGQITGGHGTGKSTLLAALTPVIEGRGRLVESVTLAAGQRRLPRRFLAPLRSSAGRGIATVDGFEQLYFWDRLLLKRACRRHGIGLVVASHRGANLPSLYETAVDAERAWRVVQRLQSGFPPRIGIGDLLRQLARRQGNLREALFDLYDLYESRDSLPAAKS